MTDFIDELKKTKEMFPELRYGQILNDALQLAYGRTKCDCGNGLFRCRCPNVSGAAYDTFHMGDGDLAKAIREFRASLSKSG